MSKLESLRKHLLKTQQYLDSATTVTSQKRAWYQLEIKRTKLKIEDLELNAPAKR